MGRGGSSHSQVQMKRPVKKVLCVLRHLEAHSFKISDASMFQNRKMKHCSFSVPLRMVEHIGEDLG